MRIAQARALLVFGFLAAVAAASSWYAVANDSQSTAGADCPPGAIPVDVSTVPEPDEVAVNMYNATDTSGLADSAASQLKEYGFEVLETGNVDPDDPESAATEIHYGPETVAGAHLLRSYFVGEEHYFDIDNEEESVTVILGPNFQQVNTESDAVHAMAQLGRPRAPEGTCPVE